MNNFTYNRWLSVITLLLLTANILTLALLWTNKSKDRGDLRLPPTPNGGAFEFLNKELKLDPAQQEAYKKWRDEHREGEKGFQDSIRRSKDNFFELIKRTNVSDSVLLAYSSRVGAFEQQRDILTFKHFQKLRAICNKEQQTKFDNIIEDVLRRMGGPKRPPGPPLPGMEKGEINPPPPQE